MFMFISREVAILWPGIQVEPWLSQKDLMTIFRWVITEVEVVVGDCNLPRCCKLSMHNIGSTWRYFTLAGCIGDLLWLFNFWKLSSWGFLAYNNHSHHEAPEGCGNEGPVAGNRTLHGKLAGCRTLVMSTRWGGIWMVGNLSDVEWCPLHPFTTLYEQVFLKGRDDDLLSGMSRWY